jgi:hypothetical protein
MRVFWGVPEAAGIEMVVLLRVAEQVELQKRVVVEPEPGIRPFVAVGVQFQLVVLLVGEQCSSCRIRSR